MFLPKFLCKLLLISISGQACTILIKVIANGIEPLIFKVVGWVFSCQLEKLIDILRHGKQAWPCIKPEATVIYFGQLTARLAVRFEYLNSIAFYCEPDSCCNTGNAGTDDDSFFNFIRYHS